MSSYTAVTRTRAGGTERVSQSDRASVGIAPTHVQVQVAQGLHDHGGEGLVDLDEVDVLEPYPAARQGLLQGVGGLGMEMVVRPPVLPEPSIVASTCSPCCSA